MKVQHRFAPGCWTDIIQINSKSGLEGSNRNFAYAGSKFGGIGLTQSFALELVEHNIKVNSVCPGNLFDGPLWSDPQTGLFVQYLRAGKVPGAKTIEEVRRHLRGQGAHGPRLHDPGRGPGHLLPDGAGIRNRPGAAGHRRPGHAEVGGGAMKTKAVRIYGKNDLRLEEFELPPRRRTRSWPT